MRISSVGKLKVFEKMVRVFNSLTFLALACYQWVVVRCQFHRIAKGVSASV